MATAVYPRGSPVPTLAATVDLGDTPVARHETELRRGESPVAGLLAGFDAGESLAIGLLLRFDRRRKPGDGARNGIRLPARAWRPGSVCGSTLGESLVTGLGFTVVCDGPRPGIARGESGSPPERAEPAIWGRRARGGQSPSTTERGQPSFLILYLGSNAQNLALTTTPVKERQSSTRLRWTGLSSSRENQRWAECSGLRWISAPSGRSARKMKAWELYAAW